MPETADSVTVTGTGVLPSPPLPAALEKAIEGASSLSKMVKV